MSANLIIKRVFSSLNISSIKVTDNAWKKMNEITNKQNIFQFLFSSTSGGCNGFNYNLTLISDQEYDKIITSSIILIPLYNASANNSVLEIIQTNTPAFITRLPSTEEYLGKNYPMFYNDISEVNSILNNRKLFNNKYIETYNYLKNMDKSDLTYERFYSDLLKIINDVY